MTVGEPAAHRVPGRGSIAWVGCGGERLYRDCNTITQHGTLQSVRFADSGRLLFGLESDWFPFRL